MSLFGRRDPQDERSVATGGAAGDDDRTGASDAPDGASSTPRAISSGRATPRTSGGTMANIGKSITISGDLTGEEDLVIEGKVEGKVTLPNSELTIGENGTIHAEVNAKSVVVIGKVAGNVRGAERVEVQASGKVDGDITAPKLVVAEGAEINGSIEMGAKATGAARPPATAAPSDEVRKAG